MTTPRIFTVRPAITWMAVGLCAAAAALMVFGWRIIGEWQHSSNQLTARRAEAAADLLVRGLTRDMQAVQRFALSVADDHLFLRDSPYDVVATAARLFARYPYPESFIACRGVLDPSTLTFFSRAARPPQWSHRDTEAPMFPVTVERVPPVATELIAHIQRDIVKGRRYSISQIVIDGTPYQVVVRLAYRDNLQKDFSALFGFVVNLEWVRQHYFREYIQALESIGDSSHGVMLSVIDDGSEVVAGSAPIARGDGNSNSQRPFVLAFFEPGLVSLKPSSSEWLHNWSIHANAAADPAVLLATRGAWLSFIAVGIAASVLSLGMVLSARAVRAEANLVDLRAEFVASVTHELKTPIATVGALGKTLAAGRIAGTTEQREYGDLIVQESNRLARLIDNLLALSRITDIAEAYSFRSISVEELVEQALQQFEPSLASNGFQTFVDLPPDLPNVRADQMAAQLALDNLIDNAIRYSTTEFVLKISGEREQNMVIVSVSDRGCGIPANDLKHVTQRFFRGRVAGVAGSGLGLTIVKRIMADHHGTLEIESAVGTGTTVKLGWPIHHDIEEDSTRRG